MAPFEPRNPAFRNRIERSFASQPFVNVLGGTLTHIAPGETDVQLAYRASHAQQHGYVHGGVITTLADVAAAYAAMTLADAETSVLTTELKVNFLRPAGEGTLVARGRVIKPGRTLNICQADVYERAVAGGETHVLTGIVTMMFMAGLET